MKALKLDTPRSHRYDHPIEACRNAPDARNLDTVIMNAGPGAAGSADMAGGATPQEP